MCWWSFFCLLKKKRDLFKKGQPPVVEEREMRQKLYIGNLSWGTTENGLKELFSEHGEVYSVSIITDHNTGRSRGFAFVEMDNAKEAIKRLNGVEYDGRSLKVSEAAARKPHGVGDYGRSGYGGPDIGTPDIDVEE